MFYTIVSKDLNSQYIYIGFTTDFKRRASHHLKNCISNTLPLYNYIRNNGDWAMFEMVLIKTIPVDNALYAKKVCRELLEDYHLISQPINHLPNVGDQQETPQPVNVPSPPKNIYITKFLCTICNCETSSMGEERHYKTIKHQKNLKKMIRNEDKEAVQALKEAKP